MPSILDKPIGRVDVEIEGVNLDSMSEFAVKAYNNEISTFEEVMLVFMLECRYDKNNAFHYTKKIHETGSAVCYWNSKDNCERVVSAFKAIGVKAEVIENK
jgi:ATP-dependent Clp protease adapter protein ClpS